MNEGKNNISFIIPTYNAERHLVSCLESIRNQGYPQERVEILVIDGGSQDTTLEIAPRFNCKILKNPKRLAEYGVQIGMQEARGNFLVVFAADNELVGNDWIYRVVNVFNGDKDISAIWGKLASGKEDSGLNKYFELIQSDPLNWFLNKNLGKYKKEARLCDKDCFVFKVDPFRPLVWGANGLAYRAEKIKAIWNQDGYLGDNDAFQYMIEQGNNRVAYFDSPFVYHHHVAKIGDWLKKWKRNFLQHLLDKKSTRNMNWLFTGNFKIRLLFWAIYSAVPVFSILHAIYLSVKDKNIYWFYHPLISFLQLYTYTTLVLFNRQGHNLIGAIPKFRKV